MTNRKIFWYPVIKGGGVGVREPPTRALSLEPFPCSPPGNSFVNPPTMSICCGCQPVQDDKSRAFRRVDGVRRGEAEFVKGKEKVIGMVKRVLRVALSKICGVEKNNKAWFLSVFGAFSFCSLEIPQFFTLVPDVQYPVPSSVRSDNFLWYLKIRVRRKPRPLCPRYRLVPGRAKRKTFNSLYMRSIFETGPFPPARSENPDTVYRIFLHVISS